MFFHSDYLYLAIPSSFFLLVPLFSLVLVFVAVRRPSILLDITCAKQSPWAAGMCHTGILFLSILALTAGALGLAGVVRDVQVVILTLLQLTVGALATFVFTMAVPARVLSKNKLWIYNASFALLLLCATVLCFVSLFLPKSTRSLPSILPSLFFLLFATLSLPLIVYVLLTLTLASPVRARVEFRTPPRKRTDTLDSNLYDTNGGRLSFPLNLSTTTVNRSIHETRNVPRRLWIILLIAQSCSVCAFSLDICASSLGTELIWIEAIFVLRSISSFFCVVWIACIMCSLLLLAFTSCQCRAETIDLSPATVYGSSVSSFGSEPSPKQRADLRFQSSHVRRPVTLHIPTFRSPMESSDINRRTLSTIIRPHNAMSNPYHKKQRTMSSDDPLDTLSSDPFAAPKPGARFSSVMPFEEFGGGTRMSAWGTLTFPAPVYPMTPNLCALGMTPSTPSPPKRRKKRARECVNLNSSAGHLARTSVEVPVEEALLAQRLLKKLDWVAAHLGRSPSSHGQLG